MPKRFEDNEIQEIPNDNHAIILYVGPNYEREIYNMGPFVQTLQKQKKPYKDPNTGFLLTEDQIRFINRQFQLFSGIKKNPL